MYPLFFLQIDNQHLTLDKMQIPFFLNQDYFIGRICTSLTRYIMSGCLFLCCLQPLMVTAWTMNSLGLAKIVMNSAISSSFVSLNILIKRIFSLNYFITLRHGLYRKGRLNALFTSFQNNDFVPCYFPQVNREFCLLISRFQGLKWI